MVLILSALFEGPVPAMTHDPLPAVFRPAYEAVSALAWAIAACYGVFLLGRGPLNRWLAAGLLVLCVGWLLLRLHQACALWRFKLSLAGGPVQLLPLAHFERGRGSLDGKLWLGWGFRWEPRHAQLSHEVLRRGLSDIYPPAWLARLAGLRHDPRQARGMSWIHGLGHEHDLIVPFQALDGHTAVMAVTGALKTVLARLLVYQLASRGDVVIVLDPKGDRELASICEQVTHALGQPHRFLKFHPAFGGQSFRFDALAGWDRETQVASRIRLIMGQADDDNFVSFVWMTITHIVAGMKRVGQRVSIASLLACLQSREALQALAEGALGRFLGDEPVRVDSICDGHGNPPPPPRSARVGGGRLGGSPSDPTVSPRLAALMRQVKVRAGTGPLPPDISGLIALLESNREWLAKMIISLTPTLTRLSAGDLGALLSPDYADIDDPRPVFSSRKLIEGGHVAYFGLDALSDTSVAESLAAILLADLAGTAGEMYNHAEQTVGRKVHVICDEWGDLVCEPIVQLANKARGVGVVLYLFGQTLSDLVVRMGDPDKAKRILGNMNNLVVGATSDTDTLDFVGRKFGDTVIRHVSLSQGSGHKSEDTGLAYSAHRGSSLRDETSELVPAQLLMGLPDLHYFAMVNRAQLFKGRIPVLQLPSAGN